MQNEKNKINVFEVEKFICLGTPFDYKNYLFWNKYFKLYSNYKAKLQTNGINLIPMSGKGKRFKTYGYRAPKPLIQINKSPMLKLATDTFPRSKKWCFVINTNDNRNNRIKKLINSIDYDSKIVGVKNYRRSCI